MALAASYTALGVATTLSSGAIVVTDAGQRQPCLGYSIDHRRHVLSGDVLSVGGAQSGVSGGVSWNYNAGVLSFTGSGSLASYQTLLDQVRYASSSSNPNNSGTDVTRTIQWQVNDGAASNNLSVTRTTTAIAEAVEIAWGDGPRRGWEQLFSLSSWRVVWPVAEIFRRAGYGCSGAFDADRRGGDGKRL